MPGCHPSAIQLAHETDAVSTFLVLNQEFTHKTAESRTHTVLSFRRNRKFWGEEDSTTNAYHIW